MTGQRRIAIPSPLHLKPLTDRLLAVGVDIYLSGGLHGCDLWFVDIDHRAAATLQHRLPEGWTLIYPYFISTSACIEGMPDPLGRMTEAQLRDFLQAYLPEDIDDVAFEDNVECAMVQMDYLLKLPPSRLVYLRGGEIPAADIDHIIARLAP